MGAIRVTYLSAPLWNLKFNKVIAKPKNLDLLIKIRICAPFA
jgi:hypothetical protein